MSLNSFPPFFGEDVSGVTGENFIVGRRVDPWNTYEWLVVMGAIAAFCMAWSIGANDVANAFATSVGARTLELWHAVIIAAIFEFAGAMALGGEVSKTIAGSITSPSQFEDEPEVFAYGMLIALSTAAFAVTIATYYSVAVSTTHTIIGAVLGFGFVYGGAGAIVWNRKIDEFPYREGCITVFMSWFIAPVCTGFLGAFIFLLNRHIILRRPNPRDWALWSFPILIFVTIYINIFFVLYKGAKSELHWDGNKAGWVSAIVASACCIVSIPCTILLKKKMIRDEEAAEAAARADEEAAASGKVKEEVEEREPLEPRTGMMGMFDKVKNHLVYSLTMDVHEDVHNNEDVAAMHANAEVFDPRAERVYRYLQVLSACCVSFAHGANDVANAIGPFAGIWYVYNNYSVASSAATPKWCLALGGAGLIIGLATYGYNIMKVLGVQMATMTPSRGFSTELATALMVSLASMYGLPVSTTQCIVGAEVGVGLTESLKGTGFNKRLFVKTFFGWVIAFIASALISAALFSQGVFAPSINDLGAINNLNNAIVNVMRVQLNELEVTNLANNATLEIWDPVLSTQVSNLNKNITSMMNNKKYGKTSYMDMMAVFKNVTVLYMEQTTPIVGFQGTPTNNSQAITVPREL